MTHGIGGGWTLARTSESDLDAVMPVVRGFYRHFGYPWDEARKREVLGEVVRSPRVGCLWAVRDSGQVVGYALVIYFLSLEFDGRVGVLDEFFLESSHRGAGLGSWVLEQVTTGLAREGIRVVRLEVDERHPEAATLYHRHGFRREPREIWSTPLSS